MLITCAYQICDPQSVNLLAINALLDHECCRHQCMAFCGLCTAAIPMKQNMHVHGCNQGEQHLSDWPVLICLQEMAEEGTTAQVHPEKLTRAFLNSALNRGATLVRGAVQGIALSADGKRVEGRMLSGLFKLQYFDRF